jgi:hypothetical protein
MSQPCVQLDSRTQRNIAKTRFSKRAFASTAYRRAPPPAVVSTVDRRNRAVTAFLDAGAP